MFEYLVRHKQEVFISRGVRLFVTIPDLTIAARWHGIYVKHPTDPYVVAEKHAFSYRAKPDSEDIAAFEKHIGFVKAHHQKVERLAVIVGHNWQYWVIGTMRLFLHPEVQTFGKGQEGEAQKWIMG